MSTPVAQLLQKYYQQLKILQAFESAQALLSWDRETYMPGGASQDRGETMAVLSGFSHHLFTDAEFGKLVEQLFAQKEKLSAFDRRSVVLTKRELQKSLKLPQTFVEETQELLNASHQAWGEAKQTNNFAVFAPFLKKVIANRQKYAEYLDPNHDVYDIQLDDYEEGLTQAYLDPLFSELKKGLSELLPQIVQKQAAQKLPPSPLDQYELNGHLLAALIRKMAQVIGFDWQRGVLGRVSHPFQISLSANDIRLNTHFEKSNNSFTVTGLVHELGHGLYEQNVDPKYQRSPFLAHGVSLGIHESQSRLLENCIGRSAAFWTFFWPLFQARFPQLQEWTVEQVFSSLNYVTPSLIRTEADEVTYNLHIILRYEIEKMLLHGAATVADLPELWRAKMQELLGVQPATDAEGALQDVHWSWGNLGYFPTYTLGNLNAAQLWVKFQLAHPYWYQEVREGNFTSYFSWFKEHIWQHGSFYTPAELMKRATGETTQTKYLLKYLKEKYLN